MTSPEREPSADVPLNQVLESEWAEQPKPSESLRDVVERELHRDEESDVPLMDDAVRMRLRSALAAEPGPERRVVEEMAALSRVAEQRDEWKARAEKAEQENAELRERYEDRIRNQKGIVENHVENERKLCQENAELKGRMEVALELVKVLRGGGGDG